MIRHGRLLLVMARPAVVILLSLFAATGLAATGRANDAFLLAHVLTVVFGFLLFSVVVNDLADEAIDRVNLPADRRRALAAGNGTRRQFAVVAGAGAVVAMAGAVLLGVAALVVVVAGLAFSAGYSLRPVRLADRGAVASLVLPAGYVAVPYLIGVFSVQGGVSERELVLLGGLYLGFVGRIVLKDFRDVGGDALFGKRTFLVRHGRRRTCAFSAAFWCVGALAVAAVRGVTLSFMVANALLVAVALVLLRALSSDRGARRDEALISALAIVGRGMIVSVLAHLTMAGAGWQTAPYRAVLGALVVVTLGQAGAMARRGPTTRLRLPFPGEVGSAVLVVSAASVGSVVSARSASKDSGPVNNPVILDRSLSLGGQ